MRVRALGQLSCCIALVVATLAGCTVDHVGAATPQATTPAQTSTSTASSLSRPREVKIDSVRPCDLFSADNRQEFKIDRPVTETKDNFFQSQVCYLLSRAEGVDISINMLLDRDVDAFGPENTTAHSRLMRVQGFPAYEGHVDKRPGRAACGVNIGVSQGQVLRAQATEQGRYENPLTQEEVCRRALRAADLAMGNLLARG
ncbi:DUF3558 domain-containing protein [Allokutzneria sp. NRRL B-24872]|uniref:DUF3558 domain-containing protein n=1 Tax=Allokutzneria sp. NRRL B-24872 TaxID=1137961 RepID=UPI0011775E6C|nr:DUF3558 domain-containing protein [Allokutzneria sp. NRRL B-24872]